MDPRFHLNMILPFKAGIGPVAMGIKAVEILIGLPLMALQ